ncbi:glycosyl transferase family A [Burkholderia sp. WAC0059]|uniref:glycosyltransferase family 2 protein n=1 Tax=Burkholderia sp. WAC0059 TaxID=2066022 RepID=UPI000C7F6EA5|nr:glycosyltransferase family A protein [Burkholderia sp. WAC0059]PLZ00688.1 glycosyl transferase family A [Burkholderia sp. WAC0059]
MLPISIVIPCYNGAATLERALDSGLAQPEAAQIVVVDDGSADRSADIVARYARQDRRVRPLAMPGNGGAAAARNWGAMHATQPVLAFLDADDEYLPGALAAASAFLERRPLEAAVRLDVEFAGFPAEIVAHPAFGEHAATLSNTVPSSLVIRRPVFATLGGFPMDDFFRRHGGEDGALSWALRDAFGVSRLVDAKRVRMHYHPRVHAEHYFRVQMGMVPPDAGTMDTAVRLSQRFLDTALASVAQLRALRTAAPPG